MYDVFHKHVAYYEIYHVEKEFRIMTIHFPLQTLHVFVKKFTVGSMIRN